MSYYKNFVGEETTDASLNHINSDGSMLNLRGKIRSYLKFLTYFRNDWAIWIKKLKSSKICLALVAKLLKLESHLAESCS